MVSSLQTLGVPGLSENPSFYSLFQSYVNASTAPLWFRHNETSGTTAVNYGSLGATLNGTITLAAGALAADGLLGAGQALNLDGADTVISIPQHVIFDSPATTLIFLMRMRTAGEASSGYLWVSGRGPLAYVHFDTALANIKGIADTDTVDGTTITSSGIDTGWVLLFRTYDDAGDRKVRFYIGNATGLTELPTGTQTASTGTLRPVVADTLLGANAAVAPTRACDGWLDETILVTRVLSQAEMRAVVSSCPF